MNQVLVSLRGRSGGRFHGIYTVIGGFPDITGPHGVNAALSGWYWAPYEEGDALLER